MKERPIIFNTDMVRALLDGRKTQTRRIVKHKYPQLWRGGYYPTGKVLDDLKNQQGAFMEFRHETQDEAGHTGSKASALVPCPLGQPGDQLWVRETYSVVPKTAYRMSEGVQQLINPNDNDVAAIFRAGWDRSTGGFSWKRSSHMPRWASRILLEITNIRVERVQDITEADAVAEGVQPNCAMIDHANCDHGGEWFRYGSGYEDFPAFSAKESYESLWQTLYGTWNENPWVWVIEFKRIEAE